MKEFGSEFWSIDIDNNDNELKFLDIGFDNKLLMSGRSAIDYVIKDIGINGGIVYMPNYCCESMVAPFLSHGFVIEYYNVDVVNNLYVIDINKKCDIFFAMSYFGYGKSNMDKYIKKYSNQGIIVIEDITHRLLCKNNHSKYSTYLVASFRKWFPVITGGLAVSMNNRFSIGISNYSVNEDLVKIRKQAMKLKRKYIDGNQIDKVNFLKLYNESNNMFNNYVNFKIDDISIKILKSLNIKMIKRRRRANVRLIENKLKEKGINLLFELNRGDCPLFVPIILKNRNVVRKELIDNRIYCPIHWPNFNNFDNDIYDKELSLPCDQRYSKSDILGYISVLLDIVGE